MQRRLEELKKKIAAAEHKKPEGPASDSTVRVREEIIQKMEQIREQTAAEETAPAREADKAAPESRETADEMTGEYSGGTESAAGAGAERPDRTSDSREAKDDGGESPAAPRETKRPEPVKRRPGEERTEHTQRRTSGTGGNRKNARYQSARKKNASAKWVILLLVVLLGTAGLWLLGQAETGKGPEGEDPVPPQVHETVAGTEGKSLHVLEPLRNGGVDILPGGRASNGQSVESRLTAPWPAREIEYHLGGGYDTFSALLYVDPETETPEEDRHVQVYADGRLVYDSPELHAGSEPLAIDAAIEECNVLTIYFPDTGIFVADGHVRNKTPREEIAEEDMPAAPEELPVWVTELTPLQTNGVVAENDTGMRTNIGKQAGHLIWAENDHFLGQMVSNISYYLEGKYSRLTGLWAVNFDERDRKGAGRIRVYADEEKVYESEIISSGSLPLEVDVDIRNCDKLEIEFLLNTGKKSKHGLYLCNARLYPGEPAPVEATES